MEVSKTSCLFFLNKTLKSTKSIFIKTTSELLATFDYSSLLPPHFACFAFLVTWGFTPDNAGDRKLSAKTQRSCSPLEFPKQVLRIIASHKKMPDRSFSISHDIVFHAFPSRHHQPHSVPCCEMFLHEMQCRKISPPPYAHVLFLL